MLFRESETIKPEAPPPGIPKCPTGIRGLDDITQGGIPRGRPTLVCGGAGCGKTLLGMEFLVRGATQFNETGVCLSFEETAGELGSNVSSLGFEVDRLIAEKRLVVDHIDLERSLIHETGDYDLEGLFLRLGHAVDSIGAKRLLLDGIEALFAGLSDDSILRSELRRLFRWFKDKKLTVVITAERGPGALTRHGLEEYISDCVILLDHRVDETVLTRRLRIVKYRGSTHGTNEYPFLIESTGISVLPLSSTDLKYVATDERIPSGVPALDVMLGGKGYFRGSSILVSGSPGTGKTSLSAHFVHAACLRSEKCVFFSFEESANQIIRNIASMGIDLARWVDRGLLHFQCARPATFGLEMHLVKLQETITQTNPAIVVIDPIAGLMRSAAESDTSSMLLRLVDFLKGRQITSLMTTLTKGSGNQEQPDVSITSLVDTQLLLRDIEIGGERNRGLYILKGRGLAHSNQIREFLLTDHGIELREVYLGDAGLLTGSARVTQEAKDASSEMSRKQEVERKQLVLQRKSRLLAAQIAALKIDLEEQEQESRQLIEQEEFKLTKSLLDRTAMARSRFSAFELVAAE